MRVGGCLEIGAIFEQVRYNPSGLGLWFTSFNTSIQAECAIDVKPRK